MSLDVYLVEKRPTEVFTANITHNLTTMAEEAGIYQHLWRPDEIGIKVARELIEPLRAAITLLESDPERFRPLGAKNGWGTYAQFVPFVREYLQACEQTPGATIQVSR